MWHLLYTLLWIVAVSRWAGPGEDLPQLSREQDSCFPVFFLYKLETWLGAGLFCCKTHSHVISVLPLYLPSACCGHI